MQTSVSQQPNSSIVAPDFTIVGPPGSKTVIHKKQNALHDKSNAEMVKLLAIAKQLPPIAFDALFEEDTVELILNPDGKIWHERLGKSMVHICDMAESRAYEFIYQIAGCLGKTINQTIPYLEGTLPLDDSRFTALIPPIVFYPAFSIRKRAVRIFTLAEYVTSGVMTMAQCELLRRAVMTRKNILIIGGTGSGKTTLGNAVLNEASVLDPKTRQVIIEDTAELNCTASNKLYLLSCTECDMFTLLKITLRMRPDRIIVGEVRDHAALALMQSWNTGHPGGIATLHANDCVTGLSRLKTLISMSEYAPRDIESSIVKSVQVLVNIVREDYGRKVREIVEVNGFDLAHSKNDGYLLTPLCA